MSEQKDNETTTGKSVFVDVPTVRKNQARNKMGDPPILLKDNATGEITPCFGVILYDTDGTEIGRFCYDLHNPVNKGKYGKATVWFQTGERKIEMKPITHCIP